jgi:hypothetical protein
MAAENGCISYSLRVMLAESRQARSKQSNESKLDLADDGKTRKE